MSSDKRPIEGAESQSARKRRRSRIDDYIHISSDSDDPTYSETQPTAKERETLYEQFRPIDREGFDALVREEVRVGAEGWSQADEDELTTWWQSSWKKRCVDRLAHEGPGVKRFATNNLCWKVFARIFHSTPHRALRAWHLVYQPEQGLEVEQQPALDTHSTVLNGAPVWSIRFAECLGKLVCHPLVLDRGRDFAWSLIEAALQFAVLCRTDERSWDMQNLTATFDCPVLKTLRRQVGGPVEGNETLHQRHDRIRGAYHGEPSIISNILYRLGIEKVKMGLDKTHPAYVKCATGTVYLVKTSDVKALQDALNGFNHHEITCAKAFEALRVSPSTLSWPQQLPTHRELCDLIRDSAMTEERYWRHKARLQAGTEDRAPLPDLSSSRAPGKQKTVRKDTGPPAAAPTESFGVDLTVVCPYWSTQIMTFLTRT